MDYVIKSGDTLGGIARSNNTTIANLLQLNPNISNPNLIRSGASIRLPGQAPSATQPVPVRGSGAVGGGAGGGGGGSWGGPATPAAQEPSRFIGPVVFSEPRVPDAYTPSASPATPPAPAPVPQSAPAPAPAPVPTTPGAAPEMAPTIDLNALYEQAINAGDQVYNATKSAGDNIPMRESTRLINNLLQGQNVQLPEAPQAPNLAETFQQYRSMLGLDALENELSALDYEIDRIRTAELVERDRAGDSPTSLLNIERRRGAISREAQRELAFLDIERGAVARMVQNKTAALGMVMDFTQQDFANSARIYEMEYKRNLDMINLLTDEEDRQIRDEDRAIAAEDRELAMQDRELALEDRRLELAERMRSNAMANLSTISTLIQNSSQSISDLSAAQRNQINQWELQAGLPVGLFESLPPTDDKIMTVGSSVISMAKDGTVKVLYTAPKSSSGGGSSSLYTATTIPNDIRESIIYDLRNNPDVTKDELYEYYPEVSTSYLNTLHNQIISNDKDLRDTNPTYKGDQFRNLQGGRGFLWLGETRRAQLNKAGFDDDTISRIDSYYQDGYDVDQVARFLRLTQEQRNTLRRVTKRVD